MKTTNKHVAVEVFKIEKKEGNSAVRGLVITQNAASLVSSRAVFDSENFRKGSTLYFRADTLRLPVANQRLVVDGTEFVLLPEDLVVCVSTPPHERPPALPLSSNP